MPKHAAALGAVLGTLLVGGGLHPTARGQEIPLQANKRMDAPVTGGEVRAMWVVRDSMISPQKIRNAVALARKYHFNTLFVQVRGRGDAFYDSAFEPRSEALAGQPRSFDPLATVLEEGHREGLQIHAWMNTFFVWHQKRHPFSPLHVVNRHPEWLVQDRHGHVTLTERRGCEGAFLDPAVPEVRQHTKNVFLDVVAHYPVDGVHFDYVRFPCEEYSFSSYDLARFREHLLPAVTPEQAREIDAKSVRNRLAWYYMLPEEWRAWRQSLVTETVRSISEEAHRFRPGIVVSAAVFPRYAIASREKGQAWRDWLREGILDAACPMTYDRSTRMVAAQIRDAVRNASGRPIIAGVGAWQMSADSAIAKAKAYRSLGAAGVNFFSYDGMTREGTTEAYLAKLRRVLFEGVVANPSWRRTYETARNGKPRGG